MVGKVDVLCLANSEKNNQRCIAGVRLDTGGWIRPVSTVNGGAIFKDQYTTEEGDIVQPLDSVRIHFDKYAPKYHQPENWLVSKERPWEIINREINKAQLLALNTALQRKGKIFSTSRSVRSKVELKDTLSTNSLTLLLPQNVEFYTRTTSSGNIQPRARFNFDGQQYNFPITDPAWRKRVNDVGTNTLPTSDVVPDDEVILFTISLGEAFEGNCYKIIAAVFTLKRELIVDF